MGPVATQLPGVALIGLPPAGIFATVSGGNQTVRSKAEYSR